MRGDSSSVLFTATQNMTRKSGGIRDVARETGLSTATVSRVMNGSKSVTEETRQRVLDACTKLDYVPNPAARALNTSKSKTVAAIIPTIEHSTFAKYITAVEQTLAKHEYSLVIAVSNAEKDEELRAAKKLLGMGAEAFILTGADHSPALLEMLHRRGIPHVFSSIWHPKSETPTIGYDNERLGADALLFLVERGHKAVTVLHGPGAESDRMAARVAGANAARPRDVELNFVETNVSVAGGKSAMKTVLQTSRPTAVLSFSDILALGASFALSEAGLSIPDDMSLMGCDNLDWSTETHPALTTIDLPAEAMGQEVGHQVVRALEDSVPIAPSKLEAKILSRGSVGRITR